MVNRPKLDDFLWHSRMSYDLARNFKDKKYKEIEKEEMFHEIYEHLYQFTVLETENGTDKIRHDNFKKLYQLALTWVLYLNRGAQRKEKEK